MCDWSDDNPDKHDQLKSGEGNKGDDGPDPRRSTFSEQLYSTLISRKKMAFTPFRLLSIPALRPSHPNDLESSSKNDQEEPQKRMKEMEDQIAAEKAKIEAIKVCLKSVQNEYQHEIDNRQHHEEALVVEQPDLMILGLKNSGKSTVVGGLQNHGYFINDKIKELCYNEMDSFEEVIRKLENVDAKLYLIVIPNTIGNLDAKISSYLFDSLKNVAILLSKSDEQIDCLKKQGTFTSIEEYVKRRHDAANLGLEKVNAINISKFTVSALRLDGTLDESYSIEEEQFFEFLKLCFNHC